MKKQFGLCLARFFTIGVLMVVIPNAVSAQEEYARTVRRQLNIFKDYLEERDYEQTHNYKIDRLNSRGTDSFTVTLRRGLQYAVISVCDQDCSDIDVTVYDENENEVGRDTQADDKPIVAVTPRRTGQFRIKIRMYRCNRNPCYYGIGIFGK